MRVAKALCVGLSCLGLILPASALQAARRPAAMAAQPPAPQPAKLTSDVELDATGTLRGQVVNVGGVPVAEAEVFLRQSGFQFARTRTDATGRFSFRHLRGGMYEVVVRGHSGLVRAWAAKTAPPAAEEIALVVVGHDLVRGQMPAEQFFASDAFVVTAMVAAMIALPIALHNSGDAGPVSP